MTEVALRRRVHQAAKTLTESRKGEPRETPTTPQNAVDVGDVGGRECSNRARARNPAHQLVDSPANGRIIIPALMSPQSRAKLAELLTRVQKDSLTQPEAGEGSCRRLPFSDTLHSNVKSLSVSSKERDQQFHCIARQRRRFCRCQLPIISVDTKKKELVGQLQKPRPGLEPAGGAGQRPRFPIPQGRGMASPYGIFDLTRNRG